ncbi:Pcmt1-prov protein [Chytridium lagenaria]|nr:Pcmt1-prov protein [Chytridium lagenaria]
MPPSATGTSNLELITNLRTVSGLIKHDNVSEAMLKLDRANYTLRVEATISAPHMHAVCLEFLWDNLKPGCKVLDVGSGSGYLVAAMAYMVRGNGGKAVGVEHIPELVAFSQANVAKDCPELVEEGSLKIMAADGRLGSPEDGPFDCIHVGAAAPTIPDALIEQLKPGGRLVLPVGTETQEMMVIYKDEDGNIHKKTEFRARYVPLTSRENQLELASA